MGCSSSVEAGAATREEVNKNYHHGAKVIDNRGKELNGKEKKRLEGQNDMSGLGIIKKAANASRAGSRAGSRRSCVKRHRCKRADHHPPLQAFKCNGCGPSCGPRRCCKVAPSPDSVTLSTTTLTRAVPCLVDFTRRSLTRVPISFRPGSKVKKSFDEMSQEERMAHMKAQEEKKANRRAEDRDSAEATARNEMYQKYDTITALSNEPGTSMFAK